MKVKETSVARLQVFTELMRASDPFFLPQRIGMARRISFGTKSSSQVPFEWW